ncbi:MAG: hypothetical protein P8176_04365 [Gammaproteobacteria bacterium]
MSIKINPDPASTSDFASKKADYLNDKPEKSVAVSADLGFFSKIKPAISFLKSASGLLKVSALNLSKSDGRASSALHFNLSKDAPFHNNITKTASHPGVNSPTATWSNDVTDDTWTDDEVHV